MIEGPKRHVLQVFERPSGGVPVYVASLCEGLVQRGWQVTVSCPAETTVDQRLLRCGVERLTPSGTIALALRMRRRDISLVHAHSSRAGPIGAVVSQICRRPLIYTPHGWSFEMQVGRARRIAFGCAELALTRALRRRVIAVAGVERSAAERWHVASRDRIAVVPTGLPAPARSYGRSEARRLLDLAPAHAVAAWVGRNAPQKRPFDLPQLAFSVSPSNISIAALGDGLAGSDVGRAVEAAGGTVLPDDTDPAVLYAAADMLVHTGAWEGLPLAVIEAMTSGLPVVAYDVGGVSELVLEGETGICVPLGDVDALAAAMQRLGANAALSERLSRGAIAHIGANHSYEGFLDGIESEYRRCLHVGGGPRKGG